jgi:DNA-binding NtrC family response regulator
MSGADLQGFAMTSASEPSDSAGAGTEAKNPKPVVVMVDDEPEILATLRRLLRHEPYELLTTESPHEAIGWVSSRKVDLIVVDQRMPGMSGVEVLRAAGEVSPTTAWLMLTAYPGDPLVVDGMGNQQLWILGKPWNDDELKEAIRRQLRGFGGQG